ncbi:MAG: hypothetical protein LBN20_04130 [Endomicrobium sp.]|jgi:hypothetical protein|nr:hypothetical protein [Endomicrobium sp.]
MTNKNNLYFRNNLPDLVRNHFGKYVIISDETLKGEFDTFVDAYKAAAKMDASHSFIIEQCIGDDLREVMYSVYY